MYLDILPDPPPVSFQSRSLEILPHLHLHTKEIQLNDAGTVMIFLKHFDITRQSLFGVGKVHLPGTTKVENLIAIINDRMRWIPGKALKLYEVVGSVFHLDTLIC